MNNEPKDLSNIGKYLALLQSSINLCNLNPSYENKEMYKKYFNLYWDEYRNLFGCNPDVFNLKNLENELNKG